MSEMSKEYRALREGITALVRKSEIEEVKKYALLSTCMVDVANEYNQQDFEQIKFKLGYVYKATLEAVEKAEKLYNALREKGGKA